MPERNDLQDPIIGLNDRFDKSIHCDHIKLWQVMVKRGPRLRLIVALHDHRDEISDEPFSLMS